MAIVRVLKITYKDQLAQKGTFLVRDIADPDDADPAKQLKESDVKALCDALYANRAMFAKAPNTIEAAEIVVTDTTPYDVSQVQDADYTGGGD